MDNISQLCQSFTKLSEEDIATLKNVSVNLPLIAEITGNDIFIDALTTNDTDAVVLVWAKPPGNSLYSASVVGELAYHTNEPAVYHTLKTGEVSRDIRGISQEGVPIAQTVVPINNSSGQTVGVLIMERNISKELQQEEKVEFLSYTAEKLSSTLMFLSIAEKNFEEWVGNGIFVLNRHGKVTYVNKSAAGIFKQLVGQDALGADFFLMFPDCSSVEEVLDCLNKPLELYMGEHFYRFQSYPLISHGQLNGCAISVQDLTDLKKKEQELNTQSIIIKEIHHRVKNNLQNIAAVLRLQMRRSQSEVVKTEFAASISRIMSIALVHEVFAVQNWDTTNLKEFCHRILNLLVESMGVVPGQIRTRVEGPDTKVSSSQAIPLALVINELITNSLRHGIDPVKGGEISISIEEKSNRISLVVADSGEKLGDRHSLIPRKGLGMQIIDSLVHDELEGFFRLERKGAITRALVYFPKKTRDNYN